MKKMSKETAYNLKVGFGTIISNQACIEAGKSLPWWIAIILGLVGSFIPVIPMMVSVSKTNGETYIASTYNYYFDVNATAVNAQMHNDGIELRVDGDHYLSYYKNDDEQNPAGNELLASYVDPHTHQFSAQVYWLTETLEKSIKDQYSTIVSEQYIVGTTTARGDNDPENTSYYLPTLFFYYKDGTALYLPKANSTSSASSFSGDFLNTKGGTELVSRLLTVAGYDNLPNDINDKMVDGKYIAGVYQNYKDFYNESYTATKNRTLVNTTFIYWAIYLGLVLFLGLLIFLLTRGKRNFNNYLKWYQCLAISGWAAFSPGVLGMILGFVLTSYALMFFILFMGIRIMWLSMKQLSPTYQGQ